MSRPPRYLPRPGGLVEITQRTIQGRYLLRPSEELNRLVVGVMAKAQQETGIQIHGLSVLSSHLHLLATATTVEQIAKFMGQVKTNLSKEIGRLHDWPGPMFDRRYTMIPVSDEEFVQVQRLEYLLAQGCKEGLVASPSEWPGVHIADALQDGVPLVGQWIDRTALWAAQQRKGRARAEDFATRIQLVLEPIPCWRHLPRKIFQQRVGELIQRIVEQARQQQRSLGRTPLGVASVLRQHPHQRPPDLEKRTPPMFHARSRAVRRRMKEAWSEFLAVYRLAAQRLDRRPEPEGFPGNCFAPGICFIEPSPSFDSS